MASLALRSLELRLLMVLAALAYKGNTIQEVIADSFPEFVRLNREEIARFEQYLSTQNISIAMILRHLVEAKETAYEPDEGDQFETHSQGAAKENPWTNAVLCTSCIDTLVRVQKGVWNWWLQERERGPIDRMSFPSQTCRILIWIGHSYSSGITKLLVWLGMQNPGESIPPANSRVKVQCKRSFAKTKRKVTDVVL